MQLNYYLSRSIVRLTARQTVGTNRVTGSSTSSYEGSTAQLITISDPEAIMPLDLPEGSSRTSSTSAVVLRDDRRLASFETSASGRGPDWLKAGLSVGSVLLGAVVAVQNPLVGLSLIGAGAQAGKAPAAKRSVHEEAKGDSEPLPEATPDPVELAYRTEHPLEAEVRTKLRAAAAGLARTLGDTADSAGLPELKDLRGRLNIVKEQLAPFEEHRAAWEAALVTETAQVDIVDLEMHDLPTEASLRVFLEQHARSATPSAPPDDNSWREWAIRTQLAVTVDPALPTEGTGKARSDSEGDVSVYYREGRDATAVTWSVTWVPKRTLTDDGGNESEVAGYYKAARISEQRVRVVSRRSPLRLLSLDTGAWLSGKLRVTFNDLGEPSEVGGEAQALAPDAVASVPQTLSDGLALGGKISASLVPGSATQVAVDRALAVAKARKELSPLLKPASEEPETPLSKLQEEVQMAELEARLELAKAASAGSGVVLVHQLGDG